MSHGRPGPLTRSSPSGQTGVYAHLTCGAWNTPLSSTRRRLQQQPLHRAQGPLRAGHRVPVCYESHLTLSMQTSLQHFRWTRLMYKFSICAVLVALLWNSRLIADRLARSDGGRRRGVWSPPLVRWLLITQFVTIICDKSDMTSYHSQAMTANYSFGT